MRNTIQGFTVVRPSGDDSNPICPRCGHYNAMLGNGRYLPGVPRIEILDCRDCGQQAVLTPTEQPLGYKKIEPEAGGHENRREQLWTRYNRHRETLAGLLQLRPSENDALQHVIRQAAIDPAVQEALERSVQTLALLHQLAEEG